MFGMHCTVALIKSFVDGRPIALQCVQSPALIELLCFILKPRFMCHDQMMVYVVSLLPF